jgi:lipid-A-disaccharide synthase-like uncharacterized protein
MQTYAIYALGFFAQGLFGMRILIQWFYSEREGRVVSPSLFWVFSLLGSFLFLIYGWLRLDLVILIGQTLSFYIYIRNLQLKKVWSRLSTLVQLAIFLLPVGVWLVVFTTQGTWAKIIDRNVWTDAFLLLGAFGQILLNLRYLYQWYYSEKASESLLPLGFWIISAIASVMVIVYGFYRNDPVLLLAQSMGFFAYLRNIWLSVKIKS